MKATILGLLAALALGGCGVGVDDPEGQAAVAGSTSAALMSKSAPPQTDQVRGVAPKPHTALPQDPIPMFDAKRGPTPPPPEPRDDPRPFE